MRFRFSRSAAALALIVDADWRPRAGSMRVLDAYGREVHSAVKGVSEPSPSFWCRTAIFGVTLIANAVNQSSSTNS